MPCAEIHSLSLRPLNSQAQSSLKCTYSVHLEGNLQSDIQEESGRRMKILRKEGANLTLYYAILRAPNICRFDPPAGGVDLFSRSRLRPLLTIYWRLPTLLIWPSLFNICCFSLFFFFFLYVNSEKYLTFMLIQRL